MYAPLLFFSQEGEGLPSRIRLSISPSGAGQSQPGLGPPLATSVQLGSNFSYALEHFSLERVLITSCMFPNAFKNRGFFPLC